MKKQYKGHLKMRKTKSPEKSFCLNCRGKKTNLCRSPFSSQGLNKKTPRSASSKGCWEVALLVEGSLEDESDEALLTSQLLGTEGAGGVEGVRAMRQRDLTPEGRRFL